MHHPQFLADLVITSTESPVVRQQVRTGILRVEIRVGRSTQTVEAKLEVSAAVHTHHKDAARHLVEVACLYLAQEEAIAVTVLVLLTLKTHSMEAPLLAEVTTEISSMVGSSDSRVRRGKKIYGIRKID